MIQRQPATWNLVQIEQAYRELSQQSVSPALRGQLELRFSAIDHYKQVKAEYDDYFRLVSSTARKDAELAAIQNSLDPQDARPPIMSPGQAPAPTEPSRNGAPNAATGPSDPESRDERSHYTGSPEWACVQCPRAAADEASKRHEGRRPCLGESGAAPDGASARGEPETRDSFRIADPVAACGCSER